MGDLTVRQAEVLGFIKSHMAKKGYAPTLREIRTFLGCSSTNGPSDHLKALVRKGYITRDGMASRAIRLVDQNEAFLRGDKRPPPGERCSCPGHLQGCEFYDAERG